MANITDDQRAALDLFTEENPEAVQTLLTALVQRFGAQETVDDLLRMWQIADPAAWLAFITGVTALYTASEADVEREIGRAALREAENFNGGAVGAAAAAPVQPSVRIAGRAPASAVVEAVSQDRAIDEARQAATAESRALIERMERALVDFAVEAVESYVRDQPDTRALMGRRFQAVAQQLCDADTQCRVPPGGAQEWERWARTLIAEWPDFWRTDLADQDRGSALLGQVWQVARRLGGGGSLPSLSDVQLALRTLGISPSGEYRALPGSDERRRNVIRQFNRSEFG